MLRARDLQELGIPRTYLTRLEQSKLLIRVARGLYSVSGGEVSEQHTLAEVCRRIPHGVVCLLSALRFHNLTTQSPFEVWLAIAIKGRRPVVRDLPVRIVRFSDMALRAGLEEHTIDGVLVPVYSPAKTVVDCFKYRNKIGLDVALEALRECWRERQCTMDDLWGYAQVCRMTNVMRPYLESLT